jgi:hypothetical protein
VRSILLTKSLIVVNPDRKMSVADLPSPFLRPPIFVSPEAELLPLLDELLCGKLHLALVTRQLAEVDEALSNNRDIPDSVEILGFITLADIVEAMLDAEILDEFDPEASLPVPGTAATDVELSPALGPMAPTGTPSPKLDPMSHPLSGAGSLRLGAPTSQHLMMISSPRNRSTRTWTKPNASGLATSSTTGPPSLLLGATGSSILRHEHKRRSDADDDASWGDSSSRSVDGAGGAGPIGRPTIITAGTSAGTSTSTSGVNVPASPRVAGRYSNNTGLQRDLSTVHDDDEYEPAHGEPTLPPPSLRTTGRLFGGYTFIHFVGVDSVM